MAAIIVWKIHTDTATLLFKNGSIVKYWRKEKGGNPDPDDPYDLSIPIERFKQRVAVGRQLDEEYAVAMAVYSTPGGVRGWLAANL